MKTTVFLIKGYNELPMQKKENTIPTPENSSDIFFLYTTNQRLIKRNNVVKLLNPLYSLFKNKKFRIIKQLNKIQPIAKKIFSIFVFN